MEFASAQQHLTRTLVQQGAFREAPFSLIDVGCSGGIAPLWRAFEPSLKAMGIDPVVDECARLMAREKNPAVRYIPAFVGLPPDHPFNQERGAAAPTERNPWARLSAASATKALSQKVKPETQLPVLNTWQTEKLADVRKYSLADLAAREGFGEVDFIKIDIDGNDLEALHSAEALIRESPVLGLVLEVNFYGTTRPTEHTFHNTDRLLRTWGFDLFGLTSRTYSAAALPSRFVWDCPAQTISGRPYQGDALYLRDAVGVAGQEILPVLSATKLMKLACLFECFSLPDFAAELVQNNPAVFGPDPEAILNQLTRDVRTDGVDYREHLRRFQADPASFYRSGPM